MSHFDSLAQRRLPSPDARILSWSGDHTVRLWDVATGQQIGPGMKHDCWGLGAVLTKDETRILSWSKTTPCACGTPAGLKEIFWRSPAR